MSIHDRSQSHEFRGRLMLWATKRSLAANDRCTCYFTTDPDDGPKVHDETCERHHDRACRMSYRPDLTLPKHMPFGWGKHRPGCCCSAADYPHECVCDCVVLRLHRP